MKPLLGSNDLISISISVREQSPSHSQSVRGTVPIKRSLGSRGASLSLALALSLCKGAFPLPYKGSCGTSMPEGTFSFERKENVEKGGERAGLDELDGLPFQAQLAVKLCRADWTLAVSKDRNSK